MGAGVPLGNDEPQSSRTTVRYPLQEGEKPQSVSRRTALPAQEDGPAVGKPQAFRTSGRQSRSASWNRALSARTQPTTASPACGGG